MADLWTAVTHGPHMHAAAALWTLTERWWPLLALTAALIALIPWRSSR